MGRTSSGADLLRAQLTIQVVGLLGLLLLYTFFMILEYYRRRSDVIPSMVFYSSITVAGLGINFIIGYLTGKQLPSLASYLKKNSKHAPSLKFLLYFDYLGCFLGALIYPLFLFPLFGWFRSLFLVALLNAVVFLFTQFALASRTNRHRWIGIIFATGALVGILLSPNIEDTLNTIIYTKS